MQRRKYGKSRSIKKSRCSKEIKEKIKEEVNEVNKEIAEDSKEEDLDFIARLLPFATRESKINDAVIYNRLELYKYETDNRKYYELLNGTELFASLSDAIIICAPSIQASLINSEETNKDLYKFINKEFGIDKMIYAFQDSNRNELIKKFKGLSEEEKKEKPEIQKYELEKAKTTEDKLKEWFDQVSVE